MILTVVVWFVGAVFSYYTFRWIERRGSYPTWNWGSVVFTIIVSLVYSWLWGVLRLIIALCSGDFKDFFKREPPKWL